MKVWILIFVCMFSMPLLVAVLHFKMRKGQILKIKQDYVKNARYFGRSLSALLEKAPVAQADLERDPYGLCRL